MKRVNLSRPLFGFVVATRAILGVGIGLLVADRLGRRSRRRVGAALAAIGALSTIPAAIAVFGGHTNERRIETTAA